ncbi:MAG: hypothetical protein AAGA56_09580 [Myxococcota bacterium]
MPASIHALHWEEDEETTIHGSVDGPLSFASTSSPEAPRETSETDEPEEYGFDAKETVAMMRSSSHDSIPVSELECAPPRAEAMLQRLLQAPDSPRLPRPAPVPSPLAVTEPKLDPMRVWGDDVTVAVTDSLIASVPMPPLSSLAREVESSASGEHDFFAGAEDLASGSGDEVDVVFTSAPASDQLASLNRRAATLNRADEEALTDSTERARVMASVVAAELRREQFRRRVSIAGAFCAAVALMGTVAAWFTLV